MGELVDIFGAIWKVLLVLVALVVHWTRVHSDLNGFGARVNRNESEIAALKQHAADNAIVGSKLDDVAARLGRIERILDKRVSI